MPYSCSPFTISPEFNLRSNESEIGTLRLLSINSIIILLYVPGTNQKFQQLLSLISKSDINNFISIKGNIPSKEHPNIFLCKQETDQHLEWEDQTCVETESLFFFTAGRFS